MNKPEQILADSRDVIEVLRHEASKGSGCDFAVCRSLAAIASELVYDQCHTGNGISDEQYITLSGELAEVTWKIGNLFIALKYAKERRSQPLPRVSASLSQQSLQSDD